MRGPGGRGAARAARGDLRDRGLGQRRWAGLLVAERAVRADEIKQWDFGVLYFRAVVQRNAEVRCHLKSSVFFIVAFRERS